MEFKEISTVGLILDKFSYGRRGCDLAVSSSEKNPGYVIRHANFGFRTPHAKSIPIDLHNLLIEFVDSYLSEDYISKINNSLKEAYSSFSLVEGKMGLTFLPR